MDVEIWSDVVCPWCYLGKARFEQALGGFDHCDEVNVVYRSFELDPTAAVARRADRRCPDPGLGRALTRTADHLIW